MADRLLVDLAVDGRVSVGAWPDGDISAPMVCEPRPLTWPMDAHALEDLRWYLEDYLRAPFGVYESRGPEVQAKLPSWGQEVFSAVFGADPARNAYQRMRSSPGGLQIVFQSRSAQMLALPWELMRDPAREMPLVLDVSGMDRTLPRAELDASFDVMGGRLRVLMVIARPGRTADVGYRMIARPLLERLEPVRGAVDLVVLRPPTLEALAATLEEAEAAKRPFQVVHFDGHGVLADARPADTSVIGTNPDAASEGVLVFEGPRGGADQVPASQLAIVLAAARVPVVVLNACQSGALSKQLEATVATRLLREGAASVVAMAYRVYAVAAADFMAAFYERLFSGDTVSAAVTAGRQALFRHDQRPSPKGDLALADWVVPVHYMRRDVRFPDLVTAQPTSLPAQEKVPDPFHDRAEDSVQSEVLAPVGVFTGRDGLFYDLETASRRQRVAVLHGPAGTGKTELAKAFGRWWQDTGGVERREWVFWHSFQPGLASFGLDGVVAEIGLARFGPDSARWSDAERADKVEKFLRAHRALLIWDNFESVRSVPDPSAAIPPLGDAECQRLRGFLHRLAAAGRSAVLVTSRSTEIWLDEADLPGQGRTSTSVSLRRIHVAGLQPEEAVAYAGELLAPYPAASARRAPRAFGELMEWLDGHPMSMRLILPHLATTEPEALLAGLHGIAPLPGWDDRQADRAASLPASLGYSFAHLDSATRQLVTAICLIHDTASAVALELFSDQHGVPERFRGVTREAWADALRAAARVGLLTGLGGGMYRIHPALPAFLAAMWRDADPIGYESQRATATRALLFAYAAFARLLSEHINSGNAGLAYAVIDLQQRTMSHLLGYALERKHWKQAKAITEALSQYWNVSGLYSEADAWVNRALAAVEDGNETRALDNAAGALWLFLTGEKAGRQAITGHLDDADRTEHEILAMLRSQPASPTRQGQLAVAYQRLGANAHDRGRLEEASDWCTRALAINEELSNRSGVAWSCQRLGWIMQDQGRLDEAAKFYQRSLAINKELGDRPQIAFSYHHLGMVAEMRGQLDKAAEFYIRSLAMLEDLGDRPHIAISYHQLGMVAQAQGRLDEAADYYVRSLAISTDLSDQPGVAAGYYQLGQVAALQGRLDEATAWYSRCLDITRELGDRPGLARTYAQLGLLSQLQGNPAQALEWVVRCVTLLGDLQQPGPKTAFPQLARLADQLGPEALQACWQRVTGDSTPDALRDYLRFYLSQGGGRDEGER